MSDRIQYDDKSFELRPVFDEVVMSDCTAHLERMSRDEFCLILSRCADEFRCFLFVDQHGNIRVNVTDEGQI